jgi:hypothetical protein
MFSEAQVSVVPQEEVVPAAAVAAAVAALRFSTKMAPYSQSLVAVVVVAVPVSAAMDKTLQDL